MGNLTTALVFVLSLNVLMFLAQAAIMDLNNEAGEFYNPEGSLLYELDKNKGGGDPVLDTDRINEDIPSAEGSISPTTGNLFTDLFSSIKNWFARSTGLAYIYGVVSAPYNLLKAMNLPNSFVFAVGTLWYGITLFLVVAFFWGRGD